jgi:hypothetical protein
VKAAAAAALVAFAVTGVAQAGQREVPTLTQSGRIFDDHDVPVTRAVTLAYALYATAAGGAALWTEEHTIDLHDGYFSVALGSKLPLPEFNGTPRYLGVRIGSDEEMFPRESLGSVPYAMAAGDVVGDVHPRTLSIGPQLVIDDHGHWVGDPTGLTGPAGPPGTAGAVVGTIAWPSASPTGPSYLSTSASWQPAFGSTVVFASDVTVAFSLVGQFMLASPTDARSSCFVTTLVDGVPVSGDCDTGNGNCPGTSATTSAALTSHAMTQYAQVAAGSHTIALGITHAGSGGLCGLYLSRLQYMTFPH